MRRLCSVLAAWLLTASTVFGVVGVAAPALATHQFEVWDTAWSLPARASEADITAYVDHLATAGFDGAWVSIVPFYWMGGVSWPLEEIPGNPTFLTQNPPYDTFANPNPAFLARISYLLDEAEAAGIKVGLVVAWGADYTGIRPGTGSHSPPAWDAWIPHAGLPSLPTPSSAPDTSSIAYQYGLRLAEYFAAEPALAYWVMGGDYMDGSTESIAGPVWAHISRAFRDSGATQPITYQTGPAADRVHIFANEWWQDFLSPHTGHCLDSAQLQTEIAAIVAAYPSKPVISSEMRYEAERAPWCNPQITIDEFHVEADAQAVLDAGGAGMLFGHASRWGWFADQPLYIQPLASLGSPGEGRVLAVAGAASDDIMLVGDSITQGNSLWHTYRCYLWDDLTGETVDFVGTRSGTFTGNSGCPWSFDDDHEAYWGERADEVGPKAASAAATSTPEVMIVHLGTNDILQGQSVASTVAEQLQLITDARTANPNMTFLLSEPIPCNPAGGNPPFGSKCSAEIPALGDALYDMAVTADTEASPVIVIDQHSNLGLGDLRDDVHPTNAGDDKMADAYHKGLQPVLGGIDPAGNVAVSGAVGAVIPWSPTHSSVSGRPLTCEVIPGSGNGAPHASITSCTSAGFDATSLPDGSYTFKYRALDGFASHFGTVSVIVGSGGGTTVYLSDLTPSNDPPPNGWGPYELDTSNGENGAGDGGPITLNGVAYSKGLGVHAFSEIHYDLTGLGSCVRFNADIGVDDEIDPNGTGTVLFRVEGDSTILETSPTMTNGTATISLSVDITDVADLGLVVTGGPDGNSYDHADWADARLLCGSGDLTAPVIVLLGDDPMVLEAGVDVYVEPGATVTDAVDPSPSLDIDSSAVDESTPGSYQVVYTAMDASGNTSQEFRTVNVVDSTGGPADIILSVGDDFQAAVDANPTGTTFLIRPGIHRFQSVEPKDGMTFIGEPGAVMSGGRILDGWNVEGPLWWVGGQNQEGRVSGSCESEFPRCNRPEDVFFDNVPLKHVSSKNAVGAGEWFFDYGANRIYVGDDPGGHLVETSVTTHAFTGDADNVTITDLVVEKYATPPQEGAVWSEKRDGSVTQGANWLVERVEARFNHGSGIKVTNGGIIRDSFTHTNGQQGISTAGPNVLVEGNRIAWNNYAHFHLDWEGGGTKFALAENGVIRDNWSHDNYGPGLWVDVFGVDVIMEGNVIERNFRSGIFFEVSDGGTIRFNYSEANGLDDPRSNWYWGAGILVPASRDVVVHDNVVVNNGNGITAVQQQRETGPWGELCVENFDAHDNTVTMNRGKTGAAQDYDPPSSPHCSLDIFNFGTANNHFENNTYYLDNVNASRFGWQDTEHAFSGWQGFGHDDTGSVSPITSTPPTWAGNLSVTATTATSIRLSWPGAADPDGIGAYRVYESTLGQVATTAGANTVTVGFLDPATAYTFTVEAVDVMGNESTTGPSTAAATTGGGGGQTPVVTIETPANGASFLEGDTIDFLASVVDNESGLEASIEWSSVPAGVSGTGASVTTLLAPGAYQVTAEVTDSDSLTGSNTITVFVDESGPPPSSLVNGGFEVPDIADSSWSLFDASLVPGWESTSPIEIWGTGLGGVTAFEGSQLIELNSTGPATVYQDVATTPGETLTWSFAHRGRVDADTVAVDIGAPGTVIEQGTFTSAPGAWVTYTGTYVVPAAQSTTRLAFRAIDTGSLGNLIDNITFEVGVTPPTSLVNGGFEVPDIADSSWSLFDASLVPGWESTSPIEIWGTGLGGVTAFEGSQLIELNSTGPATVYQDVATTPGETLTWSFAHRGRADADTVAVDIGAPGTVIEQGTFTSAPGAWVTYTGTYVVPAAQTTTRLAFRAIDTGSLGNLIDNITFEVGVTPPTSLVNGGFEVPDIADSSWSLFDASLVPGWESTSPIEIWGTGLGGVTAFEGSQLIELNSTGPATVYQDVATTPGETLTWSFAHRGRADADTVAVDIGAPGTVIEQGTFTSAPGAWVTYTGTYVVPAAQTTTRLAFRAIDTGSLGNLIDNITLQQTP